jgi:hypothetical protein
MIVVPEKTIAFIPLIPENGIKQFDMNISTFLNPLNKDHKRDWFTTNFYRCLPLSIGNMQGFAFSVPFTFDLLWNGGMNAEDIQITVHDDSEFDIKNMNHVYINSEFGNGIFTAHLPVMLKTPPGINLITIAPPNFPLPGISPMTGAIEADNLRFTFTLNFKIDLPNTLIRIEKNYPIMGILPVQRNFCDSFELISAYDIFNKDIVEEERVIQKDHSERRDVQNYKLGGKSDLLYYKGMDFRKNKFKDHQLPGKKL